MDYLTVREFAKEYGTSTDRVYEWLRTGNLEHLPRITSHNPYRIPRSELEKLLGRQEVVPSQEETTSGKLGQEAQLEAGQKSRSQVDSVRPEAELHDKGIFELSDKILSERDFGQLFDLLRRNSFLNSQLNKLLQYLEYFDNEANKFADWHLNYLCLKLTQNLFALSEFIQVNSIERFCLAGFYDERGKKAKNRNSYPVLKNLLDNAPTPNYDNSPLNELYLVLDERSHQQIMMPEIPSIFRYESYLEWQRGFDDLIANTQTGYKEYRSAVRQTLYI